MALRDGGGRDLLTWTGRQLLHLLRALGALAILWGRSLRAIPHIHRPEVMHNLAKFGYRSIPLTIGMATLAGAMVVAQTTLYIQRFGARNYVGWASGYAVIWELGPMLLGLMMVARVGARNAAELAALQVNGQLEGLRGVALDPYPLIIAPRLAAIVISVSALAALTFSVAIVWEMMMSLITLKVPIRVFFRSFSNLLSAKDFFAGLCKSFVFSGCIASVSTLHGLLASGGARAVGRAASRAVVWGAGAIFGLDLILTAALSRVLR